MDTVSVCAWLESRSGAQPPPDAHLFAVTRGGALVGVVCFSHWFMDGATPYDAEMTLHMDRPASPQIVRRSLRYAFERLGLERLTVHPRTDQSRRLAELIGFRWEGTRRANGGGGEADMYGLTRDEYRAGRFAPRETRQ